MKNGMQKLLWLLWRIWFYVLMALPILVMFPFLVLSIATEKGYPYFFKMARLWAKFILFGMGFSYQVSGFRTINPDKSYMIVANHTSMIDIMLMLAIIKNPFVFVGKKELVNIPLFGFFYKHTCILVDRACAKSRNAVFQEAQKKIDMGRSICIFPEGGVPDDEAIVLDDFRDGAFRLALDHHLPILPITFPDNKKRFSYTFFSGAPGLLRVYFHESIPTEHLSKHDKKALKEQVHSAILHQLQSMA